MQRCKFCWTPLIITFHVCLFFSTSRYKEEPGAESRRKNGGAQSFCFLFSTIYASGSLFMYETEIAFLAIFVSCVNTLALCFTRYDNYLIINVSLVQQLRKIAMDAHGRDDGKEQILMNIIHDSGEDAGEDDYTSQFFNDYGDGVEEPRDERPSRSLDGVELEQFVTNSDAVYILSLC